MEQRRTGNDGNTNETGTSETERNWHRRWKEKWIGDVGILHSYKRHMAVLQGDMEEASKMMNILESVAQKEKGERGKWKINNPNGTKWRVKKEERNENKGRKH